MVHGSLCSLRRMAAGRSDKCASYRRLGAFDCGENFARLGQLGTIPAAVDQLRRIEVPESRDDVESEQMERAYRADRSKETSRTPMPGLPGAFVTVTNLGGAKLDPLYPEPLQSLIDSVGPQKWKLLRQWADSPNRDADVAELLSFGKPHPDANAALGRPMGGNALSRAQTLLPNFDRLNEVPRFYLQYGSGDKPRLRLVRLISAHVDRNNVPVLHCFSYDDQAERYFRLDKIASVRDEQNNVQPLADFWKRTIGIQWSPKGSV
jgi:hypothetical protein